MKKFPFLLLDAGPIIKLWSLGIWDEFLKYSDVTISRIIAEDQALYTEDGCQHIDLAPYEEKRLIKLIDVELTVVQTFHSRFDLQYKEIIHAGEKETLAFLSTHSEPYLLCAADRAVFRVLGLLGKGERGIFLEEILDKIGRSQKSLEWKYTKKFREKYTRMGEEDSIQDKDLL